MQYGTEVLNATHRYGNTGCRPPKLRRQMGCSQSASRPDALPLGTSSGTAGSLVVQTQQSVEGKAPRVHHVHATRRIPFFTLPMAPPYEKIKTYSAAVELSQHFPGVSIEREAAAWPTLNGFDIVGPSAGSGTESIHVLLARVIVKDKWTMPLQKGDAVVMYKVPKRPDLDHMTAIIVEDRAADGSYKVTTRKQRADHPDGPPQPAEDLAITAASLTFSWWAGREMWMNAVRLAGRLRHHVRPLLYGEAHCNDDGHGHAKCNARSIRAWRQRLSSIIPVGRIHAGEIVVRRDARLSGVHD